LLAIGAITCLAHMMTFGNLDCRRAVCYFMTLRLLLLLLAPMARADRLSSTFDQPLQELSNQVSIELHDGYAEVTQRRTFVGGGPQADELSLELTLPNGATASHLAIRAGDTWHAGELFESEEAARKYQRLTGHGAAKLKDPAILYWISHGQLGLQLFPVVVGKESVIEVRYTAPIQFIDGVFHLELPLPLPRQMDEEETANNLAAIADIDLRIARIDPVFQSVTLNRNKIDRSSSWLRVVASKDQRTAHLRMTPAKPFDVRGRLAQVDLNNDQEAVRVDVEVGTLSALPATANVVFVIDASRSVGSIGLARQLAAARAIAAQFPTARFEVTTFARRATRHSKAFVDQAAVDKLLRGLTKLRLQNGSELPAAVAGAIGLLAAAPSKDQRIIAFSDGNVRGTTSAAELSAALAKPAVLHIVQISRAAPGDDGAADVVEQDNKKKRDDSSLTEDTNPLWSPAVTGSGGIVASLFSSSWHGVDFREAVLHLVRPTRWSNVHIVRAPEPALRDRMSPEDATAALTLGDLHEGDALQRSFAIDKNEVTPVVSGRLWAKAVSFSVQTAPTFQKTAAALMIGDSDSDWNSFEMMRLAVVAHAVSPVTSLLAVEPGTRPSTQGLVRSSGLGGGGSGRGSGASVHRIMSTMVLRSWDDVLPQQRRACLAAHPSAVVFSQFFVLQRGHGEVVDVQPILSDGTALTPLQNCFLEAIWSHELTGTEPPEDIISLSSR
jgi:Mg-chelatase subunit ChlD